MRSYAVFFCDEQGSSIQPVQAVDPGHAEEIFSALLPGARMSVIEVSQLPGLNRWRLLLAWLEALDAIAK